MNLLEIVSADVDLTRTGSTNGGEYHGPCPKCGGGDRFTVWPAQEPHGRFWCRRCGISGDDVDYLVDIREMTMREALEARGRSGGHILPIDRPKATQITAPKELPEVWHKKARELCNIAYKTLWSDVGAPARAYLNARGLTDDTIKAAALGYTIADGYDPPGAWGFGEGRKVWIPGPSIVIPKAINGKVYGVKFRRMEADPKYIQIRGSQTVLFGGDRIIGDHTTVFMCEGEFDALLLHQEAGDLCGVVTLGSASEDEIPGRDAEHLNGIKKVLLAYDVDGAGLIGEAKLMARYPASMESVMMPGPGDLTDYHTSGGNLRAWAVNILVEYGQTPPVYDLMRTYNTYLEIHDQLAVYLDDTREPCDERIKRKAEHLNLCMKLSRLLTAIQNAGIDVHGKAVSGFDLAKAA